MQMIALTFIIRLCTGAINQLNKNLACEWSKDKIRVNTVAPWAVKTTISIPVVVDGPPFPICSDLNICYATFTLHSLNVMF